MKLEIENDGTFGTSVKADGKELKDCMAAVIRIEPGYPITATLMIHIDELKIKDIEGVLFTEIDGKRYQLKEIL